MKSKHWDRALSYSETIDLVIHQLKRLFKREDIECLLEGDGVFLVNIGRSSNSLRYYLLTFQHNAGSDEFPADEAYLEKARTIRLVKCADKEEARIIGKAMYGDPLYADECIGRLLKVREATPAEVADAFSPDRLQSIREMAVEFAGEVVTDNPLTIRLPDPESIRRKAWG